MRRIPPFLGESLVMVADHPLVLAASVIDMGAAYLGAFYLVEGWSAAGILDLFGDQSLHNSLLILDTVGQVVVLSPALYVFYVTRGVDTSSPLTMLARIVVYLVSIGGALRVTNLILGQINHTISLRSMPDPAFWSIYCAEFALDALVSAVLAWRLAFYVPALARSSTDRPVGLIARSVFRVLLYVNLAGYFTHLVTYEILVGARYDLSVAGKRSMMSRSWLTRS